MSLLFERFGLPLPTQPQRWDRFEGAIRLGDRGEAFRGGTLINQNTIRYLKGYGKDFIGIWDRDHPGPPIKTFPKTLEGEKRSTEAQARMNLSEETP